MRKNLKYFLILFIIIPCCLLFAGCTMPSTIVYVTDIVKSDNSGLYTIYYSNGTTSTITIEDGKDGENSTVDINNLFDSCVEKGLYENTNDGYRQFVLDFFCPEDNETSTTLAVNKGLQSAVSVYAAYPTTTTFQYQKTYSISAGAGVIYSLDKESDVSYIITNYHVVYATDSSTSNKIANDIYVYQYGIVETINIPESAKTNYSGHYLNYSFGSGAVKCEYVGGAMNYDIAVLKAKTSDLLANNPTARAVDIADTYSVGNTAIAIGNPEADGISATKGMVSVDSEYLNMTGADDVTKVNFRVMRIDTSVNGGNSGGGLFNINGELIGIVNAKALTTIGGTNLENMAYALPIDNVKRVADNIIYYHTSTNSVASVKKLKLGITITNQNGKANYNEETGKIIVTDETLISDIVTNGIADKMGIEIGDVITAITINGNKIPLSRHYQLGDILLTIRAGDTVALTVKTELGEKTWGPRTITLSDLTVIA